MRNPGERVLDMLEAIEKIEQKTAGGKDVFAADELIQTWVIHHLEIMGEAAARVDQSYRDAHPDIHGLESLR